MEKLNAMLSACKRGDIEEVEQFLEADATLATASTMLGSQPIHAAYLGGHRAIVELLLSRGVQLDTFLASELGIVDRVKHALDTDQKFALAFSSVGSTALHRSCYWGQVEIVRLLLERGADSNAATKDQFLQIRPLGCAVATPDVPNPSDEEEVVLQLVRMLIAGGADVNGRRRDGLTALHSAGYRGHLRVIELLLKQGADPMIQGYEGSGPHAGQTAFDMAMAQGQLKAATLLRQIEL